LEWLNIVVVSNSVFENMVVLSNVHSSMWSASMWESVMDILLILDSETMIPFTM